VVIQRGKHGLKMVGGGTTRGRGKDPSALLVGKVVFKRRRGKGRSWRNEEKIGMEELRPQKEGGGIS